MRVTISLQSRTLEDKLRISPSSSISLVREARLLFLAISTIHPSTRAMTR